MNSEARKAANREYSREKRLDPAFRALEKETQKKYRQTHKQAIALAANKRRRERYREDQQYREQQIAITKNKYRELRDHLFDGYGNRCSCCGESERAFLELDHVNGGGKKHFASHKSPVNLYREVITAGFPPIYRLLCANCNRGRQRNSGICPHEQNGR